MHKRFIVTRLWVKYGRQIYRQGELLPATFTERDVYRNIYPSRIGEVTLTDEELAELEHAEEMKKATLEASKVILEVEAMVDEAKTVVEVELDSLSEEEPTVEAKTEESEVEEKPEEKVEAKPISKPVKAEEEVKAKPAPKAKKAPVKKATTPGAKPAK